MNDVERYKERRRKRLEKKIGKKANAVEEFKKRRNERMEERMDAGVGWAYGLAESRGIDTKGMSPKEVFKALEEKGGVPKAKNIVRGKKMKGTGDGGKEFVSKAKASRDHTISGYKRKNIKNFKNGYGATEYSEKDKADEKSGVTLRKYTNDKGEFTGEREALHSKIIDDAFDGVKKPKGKPTTTFMGGGPSSGKSYVVKKEAKNLNLPADDERVLVDPDKCKHPMPEYDPNNPSPVHEESSALSKRITKIAQENGYNVLVDGTGDGSVAKMRAKIKQAKELGHAVNGVYVFKPVEDAICSNFARERTVDPQEVVKTHKAISSILPEIAADFDDVKLYANIKKGEPPVLIAKGGGGKGLTILDKDLYQKFLDNGKYEYDEKRINYLSTLPESQKEKKKP